VRNLRPVAEVAARYRLHVSAVYRMIASGRLSGFRLRAEGRRPFPEIWVDEDEAEQRLGYRRGARSGDDGEPGG
jgi:hypothetical protein